MENTESTTPQVNQPKDTQKNIPQKSLNDYGQYGLIFAIFVVITLFTILAWNIFDIQSTNNSDKSTSSSANSSIDTSLTSYINNYSKFENGIITFDYPKSSKVTVYPNKTQIDDELKVVKERYDNPTKFESSFDEYNLKYSINVNDTVKSDFSGVADIKIVDPNFHMRLTNELFDYADSDTWTGMASFFNQTGLLDYGFGCDSGEISDMWYKTNINSINVKLYQYITGSQKKTLSDKTLKIKTIITKYSAQLDSTLVVFMLENGSKMYDSFEGKFDQKFDRLINISKSECASFGQSDIDSLVNGSYKRSAIDGKYKNQDFFKNTFTNNNYPIDYKTSVLDSKKLTSAYGRSNDFSKDSGELKNKLSLRLDCGDINSESDFDKCLKPVEEIVKSLKLK